MELHPEFLEKNGKKEFVVLTYEEYTKVQELIEDYEDLIDLRNAKAQEQNTKSYSLDEAKKELGI